MEIKVLNKHHKDASMAAEYIGRGSPLGNPFSHQMGTKALHKTSTREESISSFREYLWEKIDSGDGLIIKELTRLHELAQKGPLELVCFCKPKPCHGDVIKEVLLGAHNKKET